MAFALLFLLGFLPQQLHASDWGVELTDDSGKPLKVFPLHKPFHVALTNHYTHAWTLIEYGVQEGRNTCMIFDCTNEKGDRFPVGIGKISITWNPCGPVKVEPGKSFVIPIDFSVGNWTDLDRLKGKLTVIATYVDSVDAEHQPRWPSMWTSKIDSKPIVMNGSQ